MHAWAVDCVDDGGPDLYLSLDCRILRIQMPPQHVGLQEPSGRPIGGTSASYLSCGSHAASLIVIMHRTSQDHARTNLMILCMFTLALLSCTCSHSIDYRRYACTLTPICTHLSCAGGGNRPRRVFSIVLPTSQRRRPRRCEGCQRHAHFRRHRS